VGRGQFGRVFCAIRKSNGQLVALKELDPEQFETAKFLRELRFLVTLQHPNVISWQGYDSFREGRYLSMDYCEGGNLRQLMEQYEETSLGRLPIALTLQIMLDVLQGLAHIHSRGIIHADLKPENILLSLTAQTWQAKLSDFGIACTTYEQSGAIDSVHGSPAYMAPERFDQAMTSSADLYAVGVILYEMLLGERPFAGTPGILMEAHRHTPPPLPGTLPSLLQTILRRALAKRPEERFRNAEAMTQAIQQVQGKLSRLELSLPVRRLEETVIVHYTDPFEAQPTGITAVMAPDTIERFIMRANTCFVQTAKALYELRNSQFRQLQPLPAHGLVDVTPCGAYLISLSPSQQPQIYYWRMFNRRSGSLIAQRNWRLASIPRQFIALGRRQYLISSREYCREQAENVTQWRRYNFRGHCLGQFDTTIDLKYVTATTSTDRLIGIEAENGAALVLIQLRPFKVTRLPLNFMPMSAIQAEKGFIVTDREGKLYYIDATGRVLGSMPLQGSKTAIGLDGDRLFVGIYLAQTPHLLHMNVKEILQDS
jgi:serine/threonine-protein kinase